MQDRQVFEQAGPYVLWIPVSGLTELTPLQGHTCPSYLPLLDLVAAC